MRRYGVFLLLAALFLLPGGTSAQSPWAGCNFLTAGTGVAITCPNTITGGATIAATGGTGTVTSMSVGNLSPIFTSSVATATTTPAVTFTLSNAADGTILSNITGAPAGPAYNTLTGIMDAVFGSTRGSVLFRGVSAWDDLTPGTSGQALTTQGPGSDPAWSTPVTRRECSMVVGADNGAVLVDSDLGPQGKQCRLPATATILEIAVAADGGTPNVIVRRINASGTAANLLSGALATGASGAVACSNTAGTTSIDTITTCTNTLQNTTAAAGVWLELLSGTAGGVAKRMSVTVTYSTP